MNYLIVLNTKLRNNVQPIPVVIKNSLDLRKQLRKYFINKMFCFKHIWNVKKNQQNLFKFFWKLYWGCIKAYSILLWLILYIFNYNISVPFHVVINKLLFVLWLWQVINPVLILPNGEKFKHTQRQVYVKYFSWGKYAPQKFSVLLNRQTDLKINQSTSQ